MKKENTWSQGQYDTFIPGFFVIIAGSRTVQTTRAVSYRGSNCPSVVYPDSPPYPLPSDATCVSVRWLCHHWWKVLSPPFSLSFHWEIHFSPCECFICIPGLLISLLLLIFQWKFWCIAIVPFNWKWLYMLVFNLVLILLICSLLLVPLTILVYLF